MGNWSAPSASDVLGEFTPQEDVILKRIQGGADNLPAIVTRVVAEVRDCIRSGKYALDPNPSTLPLGLHTDVIATARWRFLISFPALRQLQTDERKEAAERAQTKFYKIAASKFGVEPPEDNLPSSSPPAGAWNSENRILMRTHPVPRPAVQYPSTAADYAAPVPGQAVAPPVPVRRVTWNGQYNMPGQPGDYDFADGGTARVDYTGDGVSNHTWLKTGGANE